MCASTRLVQSWRPTLNRPSAADVNFGQLSAEHDLKRTRPRVSQLLLATHKNIWQGECACYGASSASPLSTRTSLRAAARPKHSSVSPCRSDDGRSRILMCSAFGSRWNNSRAELIEKPTSVCLSPFEANSGLSAQFPHRHRIHFFYT